MRWGRKLTGAVRPGISNRYYAIRYMHLVSGGTDLPRHALRIKAVLKALKRKSTSRQKIHLPLDLLTLLQAHWSHGGAESEAHICDRSDI